ncbi:UDP-glucose dehydrogenase family protein [Bacterioplanoides sp.]|uniref:UDP-glucose dehydrogenase family protein n=1 Tax=Bacterioplanoides sp. TaxID=2066072 RepID=UPI003B59576D
MNITVVGTGYVGLVTGACFAEMGNAVTCVGTDNQVITRLNDGQSPVFEPGLDAMIQNNSKAGRLSFSTSLTQNSDVYIIALDALAGENQQETVLHWAASIAAVLGNYALIVNKSAAAVGTTDQIQQVVEETLAGRGVSVEFDVVSNPEFLKEGVAIDDFMRPDRIVVGVENQRARNAMSELYQSFSRNHDKLMFMGVRDAEMTKYAASAMLATKISFMNEIANLAESVGVDIEQVRKGIGSDSRIGYSYIYPGCGYGGSFVPQDVQTLIRMGQENGCETGILNSIETRNNRQKQRLFEKLKQRFGDDMTGRTIGLWGLAFKPGTDDMREASSIELINSLLEAGAKIRAYDPVAMDVAKLHFPDTVFSEERIVLCEHQYDALADADAMVLVTEWKPFRQPDFNAIKKLLKQPVIIDGRNQYDPYSLKAQGFDYSGIGRDQLG